MFGWMRWLRQGVEWQGMKKATVMFPSGGVEATDVVGEAEER